MPVTQLVDPKVVRKSSTIKIEDIQVNAYTPDFKAEERKYGKERLKKVLHDMMVIREFETSLNDIKTKGEYSGIEYNHKGPAHLSIGQEASSVGQCVNLNTDDFLFGSHRSHGEILAKCMASIELLSDEELSKIMENHLGGDCLRVVEKDFKGNTKELARDFILYGTLAEVFGKFNGFNRGLGGSMHAFFIPFGSMPNNAIVGGSADISVGSALYKRVNKQPGIVICNIGDASLACGPVWEAVCLASMDQYRKLWGKDAGGAPPLIFNFFNNFYGMGGQTNGETMGYEVLARFGAGVNPESMHSERVDGYNPLSVADAIARKKQIALEGRGPVLMDTLTYRISGHSPSDASSYRTKDEIEMWQNEDSIEAYSEYLISNGAITKNEVEEMRSTVAERNKKAFERAVSPEISPRTDVHFIESVMYSNGKLESFDTTREAEVLKPMHENSRVKSLERKFRYAYDESGKPHSKMKTYSYRDALFEAIIHRFYADPTMVAYGEENRDWDGAFAVYRGLTESLPYHRLFNSPIAEAAIVGSGVGYALSGGRALVELMYCDFMGRAGDEIFNQMSKWQSMSAGILKMPLVVRVSVGSKYGAQHSQDWTSLAAHIPGLKVMYPSTPYDAKGMLNLALAGTDPVIFFESQKLYDFGEMFVKDGVPEGYYEVPEGEPVVRREGKDLTIITLGPVMYMALETAETLEKNYGVSAEVIDLRFVNPLNLEPLVESVKKTGRALLVTEACERGSVMHNVASNISQLAFDYLDAPVTVVGSRNIITPCAEMEDTFFPQNSWLLDAVHERILPLEGHTLSTDCTDLEYIRRNKDGI